MVNNMTVDMEINADMVSDVAINMASDISNTTHEWATKMGLIFNPFIRIVITAQNIYTKIVRPFTTASNQIQYRMIYIEKHLKIYMQVTFILHQKQH